MDAPQPRLVAVFASIHDVIAAEKALKEAGLYCDMVPTPRELSSDCGMSLEILERDRDDSVVLFQQAGARLVRMASRNS